LHTIFWHHLGQQLKGNGFAIARLYPRMIFVAVENWITGLRQRVCSGQNIKRIL